MFELHRYGYVRASGTANCGHPAGQYDVALVDWRQRTFKALERTLDWLMDFEVLQACWSSGSTLRVRGQSRSLLRAGKGATSSSRK